MKKIFIRQILNKICFFFTDDKHFRIDDKLKALLKVYDNCDQSNGSCSNNEDFIIKKSYGKMILIKIRK